MNRSLEIELNKELRFENVASFRQKIDPVSMKEKVGEFVIFLQGAGLQKNGPLISATYGIDNEKIDIEFLVPVTGKFDSYQNYKLKPVLHIVNAVYTRYYGAADKMEDTYNGLNLYIQNQNIHQITVPYTVNIKDDKAHLGEESIFDIYIGISPNIL